MAAAITYSTNSVSYSITNPNVDVNAAKDNIKPFTFLEFITNTGVDYTPDEYNKFYITYLQEWSQIKNSRSTTKVTNYVQYYIDFIKEIVITYSTNQERTFLSKLDFTDPVDLDIAIPFFTEKIRQIILFYKSKRDDAKYTIDRNKTKGTDFSIEKSLFNSIYNYVFSSQDEPLYTSLGVSLSNITQNLKIDLEEYIDTYGSYFDVAEDTSSEEFYNYNSTKIDTRLFFGDAFEQIFNNQAFIAEIPLITNVSLNFNNFCDPLNPLALRQTDMSTGFTSDQVIALRQQFLSKYIGTDIYYINTTSEVPMSGILIKADTPSNNPNNLQTVYTPTLISSKRQMLRNVGLFFASDNQGIFQFNTNTFTYRIDYSKLAKDKIYFFPDPNKFGNVTKDGTPDYPLIYVYDYRKDVKNTSSGYAVGTPSVRNNEQTFSPYYATEQTLQNTALDLDLNFSSLYNEGYIDKLTYDIYGNEYALFKGKFGQGFKTIENNNLTDGIPSYATTQLSTLTGLDIFTTQAEKDRLQGKIFVKNNLTNKVFPLSTIINTDLFSKYSSVVKGEVSQSPINLEVFYDTICVETPSFLVFDKIIFENDFSPSMVKNTVFNINSASSLNCFSNRFFNEKDRTITFCAVTPFIVNDSGDLVTINTPGSATAVYNSINKTIMPTIYQYNVVDNKVKRLFPATNQLQSLSSSFTPSTVFDNNCMVNLVYIKKPILTYNSLNDLYKFTYLGMDNNNMFHLFDYTFTIDINRTITILDSKYYKHNKLIHTTNFKDYLFAKVMVNNETITPSSSYIQGTELIL